MVMRRRLLAVSTVIALGIGGLPTIAKAQVVNATTSVHGLTCPFCAFGAKKRLKTVDGVKKVTVDVDQGLAVLHAQTGESIAVEQIAPATKRAGFEPGEIKIVAIGQIQRQGELLHLMLGESDQSFVLVPSQTISQEALAQWSEQADEMQVTGVWSLSEGDAIGTLTPDSISKR